MTDISICDRPGSAGRGISRRLRARLTPLGTTAVTLAATGLLSACAGARASVPAQPVPAAASASEVETVLLPGRSPVISFRILFSTGAAQDPAGKEGVAALTAAMLAEGGSRAMTYQQIVDAMYPMATSFTAQVDKEMTVFSGSTHLDNLEAYYGLVRQMLLEPGFREEDFQRLKTDAINYLKVSLRSGNDEELGKEVLYNVIYDGHPYGHHNLGTLSSLERLTVQDVRDFYRERYTRGSLVLGLAGGYPQHFAEQVKRDLAAALPERVEPRPTYALPRLEPGVGITLVQRDTRSTAISLGFPIDVTRGDRDWAALALVASYLGQHRSSNSHLYQKLREARGLNYGDYAYIEYFPRGMFQFEPDPNLARQQQIFQIWIRPVEPENAHFALRAGLYELDQLVKNGMTRETLEATRQFLSKYVNILTQTQDATLGYALDSRFYGIGDFNAYLKGELAKLTLEDVNRALREHLSPNSMRVVMVTGNAQALKDAIVAGKTSPITYNSPKPAAILEEDRLIQDYPIRVTAEDVVIVPEEQIFR